MRAHPPTPPPAGSRRSGIATFATPIALAARLAARPALAQAAPTPPLPPPLIDPSLFVVAVDIRHFPLIPDTTYVYEVTGKDGAEHVAVAGTTDTETILGVACTAVRDQGSVVGGVVEDTLDRFAQDTGGNVWYFGEASADDEVGLVAGTDGPLGGRGRWCGPGHRHAGGSGSGRSLLPGIRPWHRRRHRPGHRG